MLGYLILWMVDERVHRAREREARVSYILWIQPGQGSQSRERGARRLVRARHDRKAQLAVSNVIQSSDDNKRARGSADLSGNEW